MWSKETGFLQEETTCLDYAAPPSATNLCSQCPSYAQEKWVGQMRSQWGEPLQGVLHKVGVALNIPN